jgi:hypothetical protein
VSTLSTTNLKNPSSGSNNIVLNADGTTTVAAPSNIIKSGTAVASTSGVAIDFTGIPSWAKRVTVMFNGVSTSGTSPPQIQLGTSSGVEITSYQCSNSIIVSTVGTANFTTGFGLGVATGQWAAARIFNGSVSITSFGSNAWTAFGSVGASDATALYLTAGAKTLSGTLDRVRITTVNGTDNFDAGSINILFEG